MQHGSQKRQGTPLSRRRGWRRCCPATRHPLPSRPRQQLASGPPRRHQASSPGRAPAKGGAPGRAPATATAGSRQGARWRRAQHAAAGAARRQPRCSTGRKEASTGEQMKQAARQRTAAAATTGPALCWHMHMQPHFPPQRLPALTLLSARRASAASLPAAAAGLAVPLQLPARRAAAFACPCSAAGTPAQRRLTG